MTFWIIQWNPSLDSWSISSPRSCIQEIKKSYRNVFEKIAKTYQNSQIWPFSDLSDLSKWPLEWFNQIHLLTVHWYPPCEASCINREKVIKQFLRKLLPSKKGAKFDLSGLLKWPKYDDSIKSIFIQYMGTFLRKLYTKKEKKLSGSFWEINILSEKLTTTDDGRRTTDASALEKLRCLSAGGAKKMKICMEIFHRCTL